MTVDSQLEDGFYLKDAMIYLVFSLIAGVIIGLFLISWCDKSSKKNEYMKFQ